MKKFRLIAPLFGIAVLTAIFFTSCNNDDDNPSGGGNWLKINSSQYEVLNIYKSTGTGGEFGGSTAYSYLAFLVKSDNNLPTLGITLKGADIPTGTWELPCKETYMTMLGYGEMTSVHYSLPLSKEEFLSIDQCPKGHELIGGTLKIARSGDVYEIEIKDAKLMRTMHNGDPNADTHPNTAVTISAYFKGKLDAGDAPDGDCTSLKFPEKFKMEYTLQYGATNFDMKVIKIGNDIYQKMGNSLETFYKKTSTGWDEYIYNSYENVWKKEEAVTCAYNELLITWKKNYQRDYPRNGSEMFLGINCRRFKYTQGSTNMIFLVHPEHDIILNGYTGSANTLGKSYTTNVTSWGAEGITPPN